MNAYDWQAGFRKVYDAGCKHWLAGGCSPSLMFTPAESQFLASIGCTAQELFDYIDDFQVDGEPDYETALLVTAVRHDYFHRVMGGKFSGKTAVMAELPSKSAQVEGIAWLPRLIVKAGLKLRGEMPADLMYGCGGDRAFLRRAGIGLAEMLRIVWEAGGDDQKIVDYVKRRRHGG